MGIGFLWELCEDLPEFVHFLKQIGNFLPAIREAKTAGARMRLGSELEICGYGCADHYKEPDTEHHCWQILAMLLEKSKTEFNFILIVTGMPVFHRGVTYNCLVTVFNGQIVLIRPKMAVCDDDVYRESRWFINWKKPKQVDQYKLPEVIVTVNDQKFAPFGDAVIRTADCATIGFEICEELWTARSQHVELAMNGVDIIANASGSHHVLRKSHQRISRLILGATEKISGIYMYSNQRGCDGDRLYYDGTCMIAQNGKMFVQGSQFSLSETEVSTATLDLNFNQVYRSRVVSSSAEASRSDFYTMIDVDFNLCYKNLDSLRVPITEPILPMLPSPEEEIAGGPPAWLWDYLRRSKQSGFFLPLSGGRDSAAVACMVYCMCRQVVEQLKSKDDQLESDVRFLVGDETDLKQLTAGQLCNRLLFTCYMGTVNSSSGTKKRAAELAGQIGANHSRFLICAGNSNFLSIVIDTAVSALVGVFQMAHGKVPRFRTQGGESRENLALQNVQARLRMVISYLFAQLGLWSAGRPGGLLVLATANVDECLRGYMTKYDCSSGDINPIGSICKADLNMFLVYCRQKFQLDSLDAILEAPPTAELEPLGDEGILVQTDEADMGMTYEELNEYARLRRPACCGPYSMFVRLLDKWGHKHDPEQIAAKVKHFFRCYAINRHKATVLTPAYHAEYYSPDDHRNDHRPFLYNVAWPFQFDQIDKEVQRLKNAVKT